MRNLLILLSVVSAAAAFSGPLAPNVVQKFQLRSGGGKKLREQVVARYFDGVQKQHREQIISCFSPAGTKIRDVCGVSNSESIKTPEELAERCMDFVAAYRDVKVRFHLPPTCLRGKSRWVWANWYEEGTWSGISHGIQPQGTPLHVEGQTRFLVNDDLKIEQMVVTRTFSDWEMALQKSKQ